MVNILIEVFADFANPIQSSVTCFKYTLLLLKARGGWYSFFVFLLNSTS